jgi:hypothetical protein
MGNKENGCPFAFQIFQASKTFPLELFIPNCQGFIDDKDIWIDHRLDSKGQSNIHPAGIGFDRLLHEFTDIGTWSDYIRILKGQLNL